MAKAAIIGFGTVGGGVLEVLVKGAEGIERRAGEPIEVKYILDPRARGPFIGGAELAPDIETILNDREVTVVAEAIGGTVPAYSFVSRCLEAGKSVVTSNKELVATHGAALLAQAKKSGAAFLFEASVGGGIPEFAALREGLCANRITKVRGILNGTTNYIMTELSAGSSYAAALAEAQRLGYAERDPRDDVEGVDAVRKICILASLCFGTHVYPDGVERRGVSGLTREAGLAEKAGMRLKLLCGAQKSGSGAEIFVSPSLIPEKSLLANVTGVENAVEFTGDFAGRITLCGAGAGRYPTASAVAADMAAAVRGVPNPPFWSDGKTELSDEPRDCCYLAPVGRGGEILSSDGEYALYIERNTNRARREALPAVPLFIEE